MRTYASSRMKRRTLYRKSELQLFLLISGGHIGGQFPSTNMASLYKALQRCVKCFGKYLRNCAPGHKDLRFGKIVYILVFYNISFSLLPPLDCFQFIFFLCRVYCVTVKTKNLAARNQQKHLEFSFSIKAFYFHSRTSIRAHKHIF